MWVYEIKSNEDGTVDRYKAREVAQGFRQIEGLDCSETFSPVCRIITVRALIAIAAFFGWQMKHFDVTGAYLYGKLEEDIYLRLPEGCLEHCQTHNRTMHDQIIAQKKNAGARPVCLKLNKSIYGLKQAGRVWNKTFEEFLQSQNLTKSPTDP